MKHSNPPDRQALPLAAAFSLGLAAVVWVGAGYVDGSPLALAMTALIAAAYLTGATELRRYHQATRHLQAALRAPPAPGDATPPLGDWLARLPASLQTPVRLRIEGERLALPGPVLTPYLVGLLVLLGMLGTFLGMVVTMQGAVLALQSSTDLATVRDALAAPVQGLGLAFGTSVAGVAASAMLGLMSALCRRHRLQAGQALDRLAAGPLRGHSQAQQREQGLAALQTLQAQTAPLLQLPQLVSQLQTLAQESAAQAQASHERLLQRQQAFQLEALSRHQALGDALSTALQQQVRQALQEGVRLAGATLQPLVASTLDQVGQQTLALQQGVGQALQQQLSDQATAFERQQAAWLEQLAQAQAAQQALAASADQQRLAQWSEQQDRTAQALQQAWQAAWTRASDQAQAQQAQICTTLAQTAQALQDQAAAQARGTLAELSQLATAAAQAPQAAAELVHALRQKLTDSLARDQDHLAERERLMARLDALLDSLAQQADAQRRATEAGLAAATQQLQRAGERLETRVAADIDKLATAATDLRDSAAEVSAGVVEVSASAVDLASLSEAFGAAVQLFGSSSSALGAQLQQIEAALSRSTARSDEQLAYYVAQARELIDLSISSQQHIVQDLRQLAQVPAASEPLPPPPPSQPQPQPGRLGEPA